MRNYGYLRAIYMSFYSRKLYRDVVQNWGAGVVLYLFLLLVICWAVMLVQIQPAINSSFKQFANKFAEQLPLIIIAKGQVQTPEDKPYFIHDPDTKEVVGVIDTSGKYEDLQNVPANTKILMTKDTIYYYEDTNNEKIQKIPSNLNFTLKPNEIKTGLIKFAGWLWVIIFPVALFVSFIYRLIQAVIYAVIGKIFAALASIPMSYSNVLKLTMVCITPAIVIGTILSWFDISFHLEWLFYFIISMAYLIFALGANKNKSNKS